MPVLHLGDGMTGSVAMLVVFGLVVVLFIKVVYDRQNKG